MLPDKPEDWSRVFEQHLNAAVAIRHQAIEVLRCQPDGTWKLIVGDPTGRE
jgi:hypothetical protein